MMMMMMMMMRMEVEEWSGSLFQVVHYNKMKSSRSGESQLLLKNESIHPPSLNELLRMVAGQRAMKLERMNWT